ncbi:hypothetical protein EWM64_g3335 [Hericium alpestre]|uniref:Uncharacterized protein n=1 Tax=Hericium alpestre TaxID=135208 RepID=A0A4Z0A0L2_9AGAM|nr:hypothetical protein EWM64_g3335 [Hericium alpestre]
MVTSPPSATLHVSPSAFPDRVDVVTQTVWAPGSAPSASTAPAPSAPVPLASIIGGAVGGIVLALAAVIGWTWWGRSIKRKAEKERSRQRALLQVRENTRRNASSSISLPSRPGQYQSFRKADAPSRKVKFAPPSTAPSEKSRSAVSLPASKSAGAHSAYEGLITTPFGYARAQSATSLPSSRQRSVYPLPPGAAFHRSPAARTYLSSPLADPQAVVRLEGESVETSRRLSAGLYLSSDNSSSESWHTVNSGFEQDSEAGIHNHDR